jgi:hypothetical protein
LQEEHTRPLFFEVAGGTDWAPVVSCFAGGTHLSLYCSLLCRRNTLGLYCSLFCRRNTLVAGEGKSSTAVSINEYKYTVNIGDQHIRITGISCEIYIQLLI